MQLPAVLCSGSQEAPTQSPVRTRLMVLSVSAGKAKKVALVACMHKLLVILNAIARTRSPWRDDFAERL